MIFLTVGTSEEFPFDRLIRAVDHGVERGQITQPVFGQIGKTSYRPSFEHKAFIPLSEMIECIRQAEIVVAHAGVGSTLLTLSLGKIPIIFPRLCKLGENLDDHQTEFTQEMEKQGIVLMAYEEEELLEKINHFHSLTSGLRKKSTISGKPQLMAFLKKILDSIK
jgi:UDP-N-acetylglucosamine transferase subunit ALG13